LARQHGIRFVNNASTDIFRRFIWSPVLSILSELGIEKEAQSVDIYDLLKVAIKHDNVFVLLTLIIFQTVREFVFRDMDKALKCTDMYFEHFGVDRMQMRYIYIYNVFYDGLINFHFASKTGDKRYRVRGKHALLQMKEWLRHSDWNFENKYLLLKAEYKKISNDYAKAATCYDASIQAATKHKFIHEEAIANKLAGVFYSEQGNYQKSLLCLKQSIACYKKWGAISVARRIEEVGKVSMHTTEPYDDLMVSGVAPTLNGKTYSSKRQYSH
jgi:tetratricopeptide (TPR) repeat protein